MVYGRGMGKPFGDICTLCRARSVCRTPCPPVETLAGEDAPLRERLLNIDHERFTNQDYKVVLIELQARQARVDNIRLVQASNNPRLRLIALALTAHMTIGQIARGLKVSARTVQRLKSSINKMSPS